MTVQKKMEERFKISLEKNIKKEERELYMLNWLYEFMHHKCGNKVVPHKKLLSIINIIAEIKGHRKFVDVSGMLIEDPMVIKRVDKQFPLYPEEIKESYRKELHVSLHELQESINKVQKLVYEKKFKD